MWTGGTCCNEGDAARAEKQNSPGVGHRLESPSRNSGALKPCQGQIIAGLPSPKLVCLQADFFVAEDSWWLNGHGRNRVMAASLLRQRRAELP
mmetsp:Transcript_40842/g.94768  ORF Transcript_40842/g.94768 Transcript_40842/m.94768 type:complete len:93 (+) Transcript_40842:257-535(+)